MLTTTTYDGVTQVFEIHKSMATNNIILIYEGEFSQDITKSMLNMAELNLTLVDAENSIKKKVFNIMVECLQNIVKHTEEVKEASDMKHIAIFMIGKENDDYVIKSGNAIRKERVDTLKDKLDQINSLDTEGLKELYKDVIKTVPFNQDKGAGLGLIDIARKSGKKLEYAFDYLDNDFAFFALQTSVSPN
jgi:hypothetical protein